MIAVFRTNFRRLLDMALGGVTLALIFATLWYLWKGVSFGLSLLGRLV